MIAVGAAMLRPRAAKGDPDIRMTPWIAVRLSATGLVVGAISGFFGIGGGFLTCRGSCSAVVCRSSTPLAHRCFRSAACLTTAVNYALSGLIDWTIALLFIVGGVGGGILGMRSASRLASNRRMLTYIFASVIFAVATYMLARTGLPSWLSIR